MVVRYYKGNISLDILSELCKITRNGTSAFHIIEAAKKLGIEAKGMHCDMETLLHTKVKLPLIAHVTMHGTYQHFVVIYEINYLKEYLLIADPADKIKKIKWSKFSLIYNETIVLFTPKELVSFASTSFIEVIKGCIIKYRNDFYPFLIYSFLYTFLAICTAFYINIFTSALQEGVDKNYILFISILFLFFHIFKNIFNSCRKKILIYLNQKIDFVITTETFYSILSLPYSYFFNHKIGEIALRMGEVEQVKNVIGQVFLFLFIDFFLMVASFLFLYKIHFILSILAFLFLVLAFVFSYIYSKILYSASKILQEKKAKETTVMIESLVGYETVGALSLQRKRALLYAKEHIKTLEIQKKLSTLITHIHFIKEMLGSISTLSLFTVGAFLVLEEKITLGNLLTASFLLTYFLEPAWNFLTSLSSYEEAKVAFENISNLFMKKKEKGFLHNQIKGDICIQKLHYTYDEQNYIFKDLSLVINKGTKAMLLGKSGVGKSTLLKLIKGYYEVEGSRLFLDKADIHLYSSEAINRDIGYISQKEVLFTDTLYHNITLYREVKEEHILSVIKICELEPLLKRSTLGIHMQIEEGSTSISGGEKQRIILARFLLSKFQIYLIDEGTNQMDLGLERKILKNMFKAFPGKTVLFVSHRVDNLDLFDEVIRFEEGYKVTQIRKNDKGKYVYKSNNF